MKVHRVVISVIDHDGLGADGVRQEIENVRYPNRCISPSVESIETAEIGEWSDEHPLNNRDTSRSEIDQLFPKSAQPLRELSEEAVEAGASALVDSCVAKGHWSHASEESKAIYRKHARAVLTAARSVK